jgi:Flp pilus assembly protein TadB
MQSQDDRHKELQQRERILREREVELRLREMENKIHAADTPFHQTVKHQQEKSRKPWMKKVILGSKLFAIGVTALVAVRIASVLAGIIIFAVLAWVSYKLFFESRKTNS